MPNKSDKGKAKNMPAAQPSAGGAGLLTSSKRPAVRFVVVFVVLVTLFYVPYAYVSQTDGYRSTYLSLVAKSASGVLCILGQNTTAVGTVIKTAQLQDSPTEKRQPQPLPRKQTVRMGKGKLSLSERAELKRQFNPGHTRPQSRNVAFEIIPGCDGTEGFALLGSAVLASPFVLRARLVFLLIGMAVLFVVNTLRLVTLFMLALYFPDVFHSAHRDLWPGFIIVAVLVCWLSWARWMMRRQADMPRERG